MENNARPVLYVITLRNTDTTRHQEQLDAHKAWVSKHADAGVFLFSSLLHTLTS